MNLSQIKFECAKLVNQLGKNPLTASLDAAGQAPTGALTIYWNVRSGGVLNQSSGGMAGGTETAMSGTLPAIAVEEGVRSVERTYAEIAVGDLIVTLSGCPLVTLFPGQSLSGTLPLSGVAPAEPYFGWQGNRYKQKQVTQDLRTLWTEMAGGVVLCQNILLTRAT